MNLDFSDDQKMLKEQVRKFLADKCPMSVTRRVLDGDEPYAKEVWKGLVDMGLTGTAIPEEFGGLGLGEGGIQASTRLGLCFLERHCQLR